MSNTRKLRRKIIRTSWKSRGWITLILLGVVALFWWLVSTVGDTLISSILVAPLVAFFGWLLKQHIQTKVILTAEELIYQKGKRKKKVSYKDISEIWFCKVNAFDAANSQWIFLSLSRLLEDRDEDSFSGFSQWLGVKEPEKTVTLDLSLFDMNAVYDIRVALTESAPQAKHDLK